MGIGYTVGSRYAFGVSRITDISQKPEGEAVWLELESSEGCLLGAGTTEGGSL